MTRRPIHRPGFLVIDVVGGILLLGVVSSLLFVSIARQGRVAARLAEERAAVRRAEFLLAEMAAGPAAVPADVSVRDLPDRATAGARWVAICVPSGGGRSVELIGLVPVAAGGEAR